MPHGTLSSHQQALVQSSLAANCLPCAPRTSGQGRPQLEQSQQNHHYKGGAKRLVVSAAQPSSSNDKSGPKGKVGELKLQAPHVLHFSDATSSAALVQSPAQKSDQAQQGPKSLLGTEATTGAPNSAGVKSATLRYDLPTPAVAVRNLVELAQYAHLCTIMSNMHHRRSGYPFGTIVDFASDGAGCPLFCLSPLAIHTRNILEDPRCSLVVQMPGWSGMANARVTIFGDVYQLPPDTHQAAREIYAAKHAKERKGQWVSGNLVFFRMHRISDIYFVGGFGTVQWVDVADFMATKPDSIVAGDPQQTLATLNEQFNQSLRRLLCRKLRPHVDEAALISIDKLGADVRVRVGNDHSVERIGWPQHVHTQADAVQQMEELIRLDNTAMARPRSDVRTLL